MGIKLLQNNFTTGAISPQVRARVDLAKYEGACQVVKNAIVMAQGGVTKRPGTRFVSEESDGFLIPFTYSQAETYALLFMDHRVKFFSNGGVVMEGDTPYEIESPYPLEDLSELKFVQSNDILYLANRNHPPMRLMRFGHTNWKFEEINFEPSIKPPVNLTYTKTGFEDPSGTYLATKTEYKVSAVNADGMESLPSDAVSVNTLSTWPQKSRITLKWDPVDGAVRYEVYKNMHGWFEWAGNTKDAKFIDDNIEPDSSVSPKEYRDPFHSPDTPTFTPVSLVNPASDNYYEVRVSAVNSGGAESAASPVQNVLVNGSLLIPISADAAFYKIYFKSPATADPDSEGYVDDWEYAFISKDSGETGFREVYNGQVEAVYKRDPSKDAAKYGWTKVFTYINAPPATLKSKTEELTPETPLYIYNPVTDSYSTKTSRRAEELCMFFEFPAESIPGVPIDVVDRVNHYPGAVGIYQQRLMFGGTYLNPQTVWLSETGAFDSMAVSQPLRDDSAITVTVDTRQRNEVRHFVALSDSFVLTDVTEFRMMGKDNAITPGNIGFRPQSYWGSSQVPPIVVGTTILMIDASGRIVRDVHYNLQEDGYSGDNRSILAEHLFPVPIRDWAYQQNPFSTVYVVREDGKLLTFTYIREQEVWAWAEHESNGGSYRSVCCIHEDGKDQVYFLVKRGDRFFVERQMLREWNEPSENSWFVDCGLSTIEESPVTRVSGLDHLEGEVVTGVADGSLVSPRTVVNGSVDLDHEASHIILGLGYGMEVITVDPDIKGNDGTRFGSRKTLGPVIFDFLETASLSAGPDSNHMEVLKVPTVEQYSRPIVLFSGKIRSSIPGYARDEASIRFTSDDPFPATVLAVRTEVSVE
jgi:hypothetical protein